MKIKEAMTILEEFRKVAGDDAECDVEAFQLVGKAERKYHSVGYGNDRYTTEIEYHVVAKSQPRDAPQAEVPVDWNEVKIHR